MRRAVLIILGCTLAAGAIIAASGWLGGDDTDGLSRQKLAELASRGITPQQYLDAKRRGAAHKAAAADEPPTDPNVVGPRLIREEHKYELLAWKNLFAKQSGGAITETWTVQELAETRTLVTLVLVSESSKKQVLGPATWAINFSLRRPPTPAENVVANSAHGVEALDANARRLGGLPPPRMGRRLPVSIFAAETLSPGAHEIFASIFPISSANRR